MSATLSINVFGVVSGFTVAFAFLGLGLVGTLAGCAFALRKLRRSEQRLAVLDTELHRASEALRKATQSRSELLTELGHEIRNPLSGIMGLTHAIEETPLTPSQREFITAIRRCVALLETSVSKVLAIPTNEARPVGAGANGSSSEGIQSTRTAASFDSASAGRPVEGKTSQQTSRVATNPSPTSVDLTIRNEHRDATGSQINGSSRRALIIEDSDYNAIATQAMLRAVGVESEIASDGPAALERLQSGHFDLALMDWNLPGLMGTEVVKRFRATEAPGQRRLIIGTSAYTAETDRQACLDAGMDAFIAKPLSPEKIAATLRTIPNWGETKYLSDEKRIAPQVSAAAELDLKLLVFLSDRSSGGLGAQIDRYLSAVDEDRRAAHAAVATRDARRIHQQAHRLLAHADAVKCERLAELAARLQSEAATTAEDQLRDLLGRIDEAFVELKNKLDSNRASTGPA